MPEVLDKCGFVPRMCSAQTTGAGEEKLLDLLLCPDAPKSHSRAFSGTRAVVGGHSWWGVWGGQEGYPQRTRGPGAEDGDLRPVRDTPALPP